MYLYTALNVECFRTALVCLSEVAPPNRRLYLSLSKIEGCFLYWSDLEECKSLKPRLLLE